MFICPYCSHWLEAIFPPDKCPSCKEWMISPQDREYLYPIMRHVKKATLEDYWYCGMCVIYYKNHDYDNPHCPYCSKHQYVSNRRFIYDVKYNLKDILEYIEDENPAINTLKEKLQEIYEPFEAFNTIEKDIECF